MNDSGEEGNFVRKGIVDTIFSVDDGIPKEVIKDLKKQEESIEKAQAAIAALRGVNKETKIELERQVDQLVNIHMKADEANKITGKVEHKVDNKI